MRNLIVLAALACGPAIAQAAPEGRVVQRDLLKRIVEIPTVQGRTAEFRRLTALLTAEFHKAGITNVIVKDHDGTQTLIARWPAAKPNGKKSILLMAHMDVVEARASDWKNPPFELREKDGYYLGRGTADMKGRLAGLILALQNLRRTGFQPSRDIVVLVTGDEETATQGARRAATEWRNLTDAEYALNLDMGGGSIFSDGRADSYRIQLAEKTYADFKLLATNPGGTSATPRPDNAIYELAGALKAIETHRFEPMINEATRSFFGHISATDGGRFGELAKRFLADPKKREDADQLEANIPGSTRTRCVATTVSAGHASNALPQRAEANVNCRIFPGVGIEAIRQELEAISGQDVAVATVTETASPQTQPSPPRNDVTDALRGAIAARFPGTPVVWYQSAAASDGSFFRAAGMPVYGLGTSWEIIGQSSGAHGLNERLLIDAFYGQIPIMEDLLRRLAG